MITSPTRNQWRRIPRKGGAAAQVDQLLVVWHRNIDAGVGMVVNKSFGNAVARNKIRRRLRVAATATLADRPGCWILVARDGISDLSSTQMQSLIERAVHKIELRSR